MAQIEINSFFTKGGQPATSIDDDNPIGGKNYPLIRIWEVTGSVYTLIVGDTIGTGQNFDGTMVPVTTAGVEDGFYSFVFTDTIGYDETKTYLIRSDAGPSIPPQERFQVASIDSSFISVVADAVWDEALTDHLSVGSTGLALSQTKANTEQLFLDVAAVQSIVELILKYDTNRTKINTITKTLTVYDDDCTTVLRTFSLLDHTGTPSTSEVCERKPIAATDGHSICP
ncbi:MAG: hypothetical protein KAS32_25500 [Candidatus Peribacteraceae bacterium]|nr:hypothetical protein [Candidatus Peribacteraceae bacterium]